MGMGDPIRIPRRSLRGAPGKRTQKHCQEQGHREGCVYFAPQRLLVLPFLDPIDEVRVGIVGHAV
jgi:hypothetical protein